MSDVREIGWDELAALERARDLLTEPLHVHAYDLLLAARECAQGLSLALAPMNGVDEMLVRLCLQRLLGGIWLAEGRPREPVLSTLTLPKYEPPPCICHWEYQVEGDRSAEMRVHNPACHRHNRLRVVRTNEPEPTND